MYASVAAPYDGTCAPPLVVGDTDHALPGTLAPGAGAADRPQHGGEEHGAALGGGGGAAGVVR